MADALEEYPQAELPAAKPGILEIHAYVPGKAKAEGVAEPVKLSSNENVLGSSPAARTAFVGCAEQLHLYPEGRSNRLRAAIAERFSLDPDRLIFGAGSDELFQILNQVFLEPGDNIVQGEFGFGAYAIGARACGAQVRLAPEPGLRLDVDRLLERIDRRTRLVFVANPGNPTGTWIGRAEIERLHSVLPSRVVLVLDGAYAEFVDDPAFTDGLDLARGAGNIVVTRTFSKLHGLAALRVGWAYGPKAIIEAMDRIRLPFNINIPGQEAAIAALGDDDFQRRSLDLVAQWRPWLEARYTAAGLTVASPSAANFLLVGFPETAGRTAADAEAYLARRGLIARGVAGYGLPSHLRITIGLEAHNRAVAAVLAEFMDQRTE